ncbi:unnamed protein product [Timema podura]|uniref:Uncharacterized protein n=1 Tax=Timema podura TaxID=61482 RepID=A0ABN7NE87_TIMPD|nr:unnamed protein product [Timema podura]
MLPYTASCDIEPVARLSLLSHLSSLALHSARWNVPHPLAMRGGPSLVTVQGWLENGITCYNMYGIVLI